MNDMAYIYYFNLFYQESETVLLTEGNNGDICGYISQEDIGKYILNEYFSKEKVISKFHINKKYLKMAISPCIYKNI